MDEDEDEEIILFFDMSDGTLSDDVDNYDTPDEDKWDPSKDERHLARLRNEEVEQEAKGMIARDTLNQSSTPIPLGNLLGKWKLYSSSYLDIARDQPAQGNDYNIDEEGPYDWTQFSAGSLRITNDYEYTDDLRGKNEFAGDVVLQGIGTSGLTLRFKFENPNLAKLEQMEVRAVDDFLGGSYIFELTLLGNGVLELKVPGYQLLGDRMALDEVVLLGCRTMRNWTRVFAIWIIIWTSKRIWGTRMTIAKKMILSTSTGVTDFDTLEQSGFYVTKDMPLVD